MRESKTPPPSRKQVADLARKLRKQDERQTGRDIEYWLKAEQFAKPIENRVLQLITTKP